MLYRRTGAIAGAVITSIAAIALVMKSGPAVAQPLSGPTNASTNVPGRTVADLAMLCNAGLQDPNRPDAMGYCTGFIVGVGQFHASLTAPGGTLRPIFCVPNPQPTLSQAAAAFVAWTRANPQHANERAVDGLMHFAAETYSCPPAPAPGARRR